MTRITLTDKAIQNLKTDKPQQDFFDAKFSGGSFLVRVSKGGRKSFVLAYRLDGKRRRITLGHYPETSLAEARERARKIVGRVDAGVDPLAEKKKRREMPTLREFYEADFSEVYVENPGSVRNSTRDQYRWAFGCHILKSGLAGLRMDRIRRADVQLFVSGLVKDGYALHTIQDVVKCLGKCFRWALDHGLIKETPVRELRQLYRQAPTRKSEPNPFTRDETIRFLQAARDLFPDDHYYLFFTALQTGLRSGELQALKWDDLDLENKRLEVHRNHSHGQMNDPKTRKGRRTVDLSDSLASELRAWKAKLREKWLGKGRNEVPEWVFPNEAGKLADFKNLKNRQFKRVLKKAKVKRIAFHSLRDTFATLLLMAGEPIAYVSEQLGHTDPKVTFASYARWLPGSNQQAMNNLPTLAGSGSRQPDATASGSRKGV